MKLPLPQQGSKIVGSYYQNYSGIISNISLTKLIGVGISVLFFFSSIDGMKCFAIN
jgi:site-specific recombinase